MLPSVNTTQLILTTPVIIVKELYEFTSKIFAGHLASHIATNKKRGARRKTQLAPLECNFFTKFIGRVNFCGISFVQIKRNLIAAQ